MGLLTNLFSGGAGNVITSIGNVADKFITTDKERAEFNNELKKIETNHLQKMKELENEAENIYQKEIKAKSDLMIAETKSDSTITRIARPLAFLSFTFVFLFIFLGLGIASIFGIELNLTSEFMDMVDSVKSIYLAFLSIYVGSRSVEKVMIKKK